MKNMSWLRKNNIDLLQGVKSWLRKNNIDLL
jgi:hypothetical protein